MNQPDYSNISRCEKGKRKPTIEMLLTYQMLFNVPITALTEHLMDDLKEDLIFRMGLLIRELELVDPTSKVNSRIAFLTSALARLSA